MKALINVAVLKYTITLISVVFILSGTAFSCPTDSSPIRCLKIKNGMFRELLLSEMHMSKVDDTFLICVIKRNDTLFTYIGYAPMWMLPDLCFCSGQLFQDHSLVGYMSFANHNCYVFGDAYKYFFHPKRETVQLPDKISWLAHLSDYTSREDTLLPQLKLTYFKEDGEKKQIKGREYNINNDEKVFLTVDPSLSVYAFYKQKFTALSWEDYYPYSIYESSYHKLK